MNDWQRMLLPLSLPYAIGVAAKNLAYDRSLLRAAALQWPVISVGNLSVGGAGKTPVVIALARLLTAQGIGVDILTRGYGRRSPISNERVPAGANAERYGDEPVLLAEATGVPVYVGASRYASGVLAERDLLQASQQLRVHLLDDGFQHRRLARSIDLVVVHPDDVGGRLLPGGRLRESLHSLRRASAVILREEDRNTEAFLWDAGIRRPIWRIRRSFALPPVDGRAFAFCGIAHPEEFFAGLRAAGVCLAGTAAFRDHCRFTPADLTFIKRRARGAVKLLTTEKDLVRLSFDQRQELSSVAPLERVPLTAEFMQESQFIDVFANSF